MGSAVIDTTAGASPEVTPGPAALDLWLVVPPGLDSFIFPWGVQSLADYQTAFATATPHIWSLASEAWLEALFERHRDVLLALYAQLRPKARKVFFGHTLNPFLYLGIVGALGARFLDVAGRQKLMRRGALGSLAARRWALTLDELRQAYLDHLRAGVGERLATTGGGRRRVWGISVYDYTLFNSLTIAQVIRAQDPYAPIVLGGDYFDYGSARGVVSRFDGIDGVVVGYGEEVFRQILAAYAAGRPVRELELNGLVTTASLGPERRAVMAAADLALGLGKTGRAEREAAVAVPPSYRAAREPASAAPPPVDYVRSQDDGTIRILTQRGCSWGKCTFCSQIDRRMFFSIGLDDVLARLSDELGRAPPSADRIRSIVLDADENDLNAVLPILDRLGQADGRYKMEFWLMVRKFGAELPRYLVNRNRNCFLKVILNIESLSKATLKRMKKGVVPLQALQAVKAIQDAGHVVQSNYFMNYPLEDIASVTEELATLERAIHLLMPPRMNATGFSYMVNARDEIHHDEGTYAITSRRVREDVWLREAYGIDLPFSIWTFEHDRRLPDRSPPHLIPFTYHKMSFAYSASLATRSARQVLGRGEASMLAKLDDRLAHANYVAWKAAHRSIQWLAGSAVYDRRRAIFAYLDAVAQELARERAAGHASDRASGFAGWGQRVIGTARPPARASRLVIEGSTLTKACYLPGAEAHWQRALEDDEFAVLRCLYWRRQRKEVDAEFAEVPAARLTQIIDEHLALGTLIADGNWLLCLAHDPGYWATEPSMSEGPTALTDLEPRLPELVHLKPRRRPDD